MNITCRTFGSIALRLLMAALPVAARAATPAHETLLTPGLGQPVEIVKEPK